MITEFMAKNQTTATDEDGDFSDWIEVHNPTAAPVSLDDWYLTDSATELTKWRFPNITLAPGEFRVIWASGKNRRFANQPLHTNFSLDADGEYLALVLPDGTTVAQDFGPEFPELDGDESYGSIFQSTVLLAPGASTRYQVPTGSSNPAATWNQPGFADGSWPSGPSGLGHGIKVPGITARQVFKNGSMGGLADALALHALPPGDPGILDEATAVVDSANFLGIGSDGRYSNNSAPPGGNGDNYSIKLTGWVEIPVAGAYTFGTNSDDGGQLKIDGSILYTDDSFHGPQDHLGTRYLGAGLHSFEVIMFQGGGGDCLEFFAAPGSHATWNAADFRLVGDVAGGGLAATTEPSGPGDIIATNLAAALAGKQGAYFRTSFPASGPGSATALSLVTRHNDGFAAWLNGTKVASDNVPGSPSWNSTANSGRSDAESLRRMGFNLTAHLPLLADGSNLLAIHGMKNTGADGSFLILPELIAGSLDAGAAPAFYAGGNATPGWINVEPSSLGKVADTQFSVKRGFYTSPIQVAITTSPGASIRYTTDGSTPTATHGQLYTGPLTISSTTVLRARGVRTGWEPTDVDTQSYFFLNDVITQSANGVPRPGWPSGSSNGQVLDYGMDPEIVNHGSTAIGGSAQVKAALAALPAVSITTDLSNLFDLGGSQGIYSNPGNRGFAWERPASMEWINPPDGSNPNGTSEFQIDAGIRIRGGFSRSKDNPKHSFRMYFRGDYGDSKLEYPLFGRHGTQSFDQIDFRTAQNYSWSFGGDDRNTFLREESTRQAILDMAQPGSRLRYFHLYLNGQYWGLYNLDERPEAAFAESYFGGKKDEYDVVKSEGESGYVTGATDGNLAAWQDLWAKGRAVASSPTNSNYFRTMGLAADGVTPTADPVLLDPGNLVDYMLLTFWTGNLDGATSAFLGNDRANNWFGSRRRDNNPGQGFRYFVHDFEHTFFNVNEDRTGPFIAANQSNVAYANPMFLHQDLMGNAEYKMLWADHIQKHMFNGGALDAARWNTRINGLATIVDQAIIAESARWGDAKNATPKTRLTWINARNELINYLAPRAPIVLNQLRADGLYPSIDAPVPTPFGGYHDSGVEVTVAGPAGSTFYYMPDGSDPRAVGGTVKPGALVYTASTTVETLVPWSASGWKYLYDGSNQGTSWRAAGHNDSSWPSGTAELGYGDGDEATVIPIAYSAPNEKAATCYFRRGFTINNLSEVTGLEVSVNYDDAYAVYLNGVRIAGNLPVNPAYNYYTGSAIEETTAVTAASAAPLVEGSNVIAVEIHQASGGSSDITMDLQLTATRNVTGSELFLTGTGERHLKIRGKDGSTWSAVSDATFLLDTDPASSSNLAISEIHYHPADPSPEEIAAGFDDSEAFEFVEILNTSSRHVDLDGVYFYGAIAFNFSGAPTGRTLAPGARLLVVADPDAFAFRYGSGKPVAGKYSGQLNNAGENLVLYTPGDNVIRGVDYGDDAPWSP
ncbi:lamin tail domain-containing protein, partial [Luteolibacter marinus]|uniref:lamin tail domain-containing protein n=1 Tax=Luteolibacter marinus TaxID=2776705 RepID=UPI001867A8F8